MMLDINTFMDTYYPTAVLEVQHEQQIITMWTDPLNESYVVTIKYPYDDDIGMLPQNFQEAGFADIKDAMIAVAVIVRPDSDKMFDLIAEESDEINIYYHGGTTH